MYYSDMELFNRKLPPFIKRYRLKRKLTQSGLSAVAKIDYKHIQVLESFRFSKDPRISTIRKLSRALNVPTHDLIERCFSEEDPSDENELPKVV
ncbi:MAG: helix-turn-helix transcriptional regulator [Spirochaetes bacterium]|nr:helix-turn-helix transcriptional regulator [Spirochaetota bacterium]